MKFKLDENFGTRTQQLFREAGHEVQTVRDEKLEGSSDQHLYDVCCAEQLCLVTLDLDFADVIRFPPSLTGGTVVIRIPKNPSLSLLEHSIRQFLQMLTQASIERQFWVIEVGRIRVHQSEEDEN
jgi:predicted nuclease of predicted toxin-antitoxin system